MSYKKGDRVMLRSNVVEIPMYDKPEATKSILLEAACPNPASWQPKPSPNSKQLWMI